MSMTNEQREAIEICKEKIIESFYDFPNPTSIELKDTDVEAIEIVLSLIKEQQEETDKYKTLYERALTDLVKADKQIELMADKLVEAHEWFYSEFDNFTKEDFIKYFADLVEKE